MTPGLLTVVTFAPLVGAIALLLGKKTGTDCRGWFFNPYRPAVERPRSALVAAVLKPVVRRLLDRMMRPS